MKTNFFFPIGLIFYLIVAVYKPETSSQSQSVQVSTIDTNKLQKILSLIHAPEFSEYNAILATYYQQRFLSTQQKAERDFRKRELEAYFSKKALEGGFEIKDLFMIDRSGNGFLDEQRNEFEYTWLDQDIFYHPDSIH